MTDFQFQCLNSIVIAGGQSLFCGYERIGDIKAIKLNNEQETMFLECGSVFVGLLGDLISRELKQVNDTLLESIVPLVTFREHLSLLITRKSYLSEAEINFFQFLFNETKTWKPKGCDLVCISGEKEVESSNGL